MKKGFKVGDRVAIFARTIGSYVFEGYAVIVAPSDYDRWRVRFEDDGYVASRFVDPRAQWVSPDCYIETLNRNRNSSSAY